MSRKALFEFVFSPFVFFHLLLAVRAVFYTTLEFIRPARTLSYRTVILKDLLDLAMYINVVFPLALPDFPLGLGTRENPVRLVLGV